MASYSATASRTWPDRHPARTLASTSARASIASPWCESRSVAATSRWPPPRAAPLVEATVGVRVSCLDAAPDDLGDDSSSAAAPSAVCAQRVGLDHVALGVDGVREHGGRRREHVGRRPCSRASRCPSAAAPRRARAGRRAAARRRHVRHAASRPPSCGERLVASPATDRRASKSPFIACSSASGLSIHVVATGLAVTMPRNASQRAMASSTGVGPSTAAVARQPRTSKRSRSSPARRAHAAARAHAASARCTSPAVQATWARSDQARHWPWPSRVAPNTVSAASARAAARSMPALGSVSRRTNSRST